MAGEALSCLAQQSPHCLCAICIRAWRASALAPQSDAIDELPPKIATRAEQRLVLGSRPRSASMPYLVGYRVVQTSDL